MWILFFILYHPIRVGHAASAADCIVKAMESLNFPIERYYPNVEIRLTEEGTPQFSRDSAAFQLWRQKTPSAVPDTDFPYHYMKGDLLKQHVALQTMAVAKRGMRGQDVGKFLFPNREALMSKLHSVPNTQNAVPLNYISYKINGEPFFVFFESPLTHVWAARMLQLAHPEIRFFQSGTIDFLPTLTRGRRVDWAPGRIDNFGTPLVQYEEQSKADFLQELSQFLGLPIDPKVNLFGL